MMRAKMRLESVDEGRDKAGQKYNEVLTFVAVAKSTSYPADGADEDNTFARWTPTARATFDVRNPDLWGKFTPGEVYYSDFTPAPKPAELPQAHAPSAA